MRAFVTFKRRNGYKDCYEVGSNHGIGMLFVGGALMLVCDMQRA